MSPEEQDEMDQAVAALDYVPLLELGQLSDVVGNLAEQRPAFSDDDQGRAIRYYWENDAFIDLASEES